ncbi:hypothetical protein C0Q70_15836 [Pomacea canaliculata]|uniref:guanylate cyclase n=2 Tax=Pomacea canaliculata TaxID=400727 RepID=A0A2T7NW08_POMCA|nr:hypothetical protein C0Q70_15836 [Pomacea canaliculata]
MIWLEDEQRVMFIGSPRLKSLDEMKRMNIYMADIPLFDVTREIVLLYEQRNAEIGITQKLDLTMAELTRTSLALEVEKRKTEQLLHQMLPPKVAMQLKNGDIVEAETFQQATIMFSDIVGFTNIAATCPPETIVNMLNDMYERFDRATNSWDVYKVETIGDAYMVVGGVPELREDHSERVARFAMTIVQEAVQVPSPATGSPLQIRVGIHTGPVMAGVVGIKMPRYCLFGDTVNTASRMESHSVPGRIHLSREVFSQLVNKGFRMKKRGLIEVKGKGLLTTYFLVGDGHINVTEPEDKFMSFPVLTNDEQETTEPVASYVTKLSEEGSTDSGHCLDSQEKRKHVRSQHEAPDRRAMPISPRVVKPNYTFLSSASNQLQPTSTEKVRSSYCSVL